VFGNTANDFVSGGTGNDRVDGGNGIDKCWPELVVVSAGTVPPVNPNDSTTACEQINVVLN